MFILFESISLILRHQHCWWTKSRTLRSTWDYSLSESNMPNLQGLSFCILIQRTDRNKINSVWYSLLYCTSGVCLAISRISVATFFLTYSSGSLRQVSTAGKISASTTISARSNECLEIWLRAEKTWGWNEREKIAIKHIYSINSSIFNSWNFSRNLHIQK